MCFKSDNTTCVLPRIERNISVAAMLEILLNKTSQSQIKVIEDYTKMVLACLFVSYRKFGKTLAEINKMCPHLNALKKKSTEAFKPFVSYSTKTLCHSMGSPLKVAEDIVRK
jgi:hypothetical protein